MGATLFQGAYPPCREDPFMDLKEMATQMFLEKLGGRGGNVDAGAAGNALSELLGEGQKIDLGGLMNQMAGSGLGDLAKSWLGDGANQAVSAQQVTDGIGLDDLMGFAKQLGLDQNDAAGALAEIIPNLVDQNSKGGDLLGGLGSLAQSFFK